MQKSSTVLCQWSFLLWCSSPWLLFSVLQVHWPSLGFNSYSLTIILLCWLHFKPCLVAHISVAVSMLHFQRPILVCMFLVLPCSPDKRTTAYMTAQPWTSLLFAIFKNNQSYWLYFNFSSNGTFVNGEKIGKVFSFFLFLFNPIWIYCTISVL